MMPHTKSERERLNINIRHFLKLIHDHIGMAKSASHPDTIAYHYNKAREYKVTLKALREYRSQNHAVR